MELRQLEHFLAIVEAGSVAKAARKLRMSQPALSLSLRSLERSIGASLFVRSSGGMTPTLFGQSLERRANLILNETANAERDIIELLDGERGSVTIGAGPTFSESIMALACSRFCETNPGVSVGIVENYTDRLIPMVVAGAIDCAFVGIGARSLPREAVREILLPAQQAIVATGPDHPLTGRRRVTPQEAAEARWALPRPSDFLRVKLEELFTRHDIAMPPAAFEYSSVGMEKSVLRRGLHLGVLTELTAREDILAGTLREVRVPELKWSFAAGVVLRRGAMPTPATQKFIECVRGICNELFQKQKRRRPAA